MFDYFKKMKQTQHEAEENEPQESKPKKDIVFIIILIMFGAIIAVGLITGINDLAGDTAQDTNLVFRFSVTDGIILGGITVAYIVTHIRKGRKLLADKEKKFTQELERCRANVKKTKELIEYHKNMLKIYENKEAELMSKLDEVKMNSLCVMINKNGYDIDLLREAVRLGDFSAILQQKKEIISESEGIKREKSILNDET